MTRSPRALAPAALVAWLALSASACSPTAGDAAIEPTPDAAVLDAADDGATDDASIDAPTDATDAADAPGDATSDAPVGDVATDAPPVDAPAEASVVCEVGVACGAQCVDTTSDPSHCGSCGVACPSGDHCCSGGCVATSTCSFSVGLLYPDAIGLNGGFVTIKGAGFISGARVKIGGARVPSMFRDAQTLFAEAPPHAAGTADIEVAQGPQTATRHFGLTYVAVAPPAAWSTASLPTLRAQGPALAALHDGRALVAGGEVTPGDTASASAGADVYDPTTHAATHVANDMGTGRVHAAAVTLLDGRVLVVGGACSLDGSACTGEPRAASLYSPLSNNFTPTGTVLHVGRVGARAVLLTDGRALVASSNAASLELYDPFIDTFQLVPHDVLHPLGFVVRIGDGRVMLGGGDVLTGGGIDGKTVELYDPTSGAFTTTGSLATPRAAASATVLPDGRVLVVGGTDFSAATVNAPLASAEAWDPATGLWTTLTATLDTPRAWHAGVLVTDGTLLVLGGYAVKKACTPASAVARLDAAAGAFGSFGALPRADGDWQGVALAGGAVVVAGGALCGSSDASLVVLR